MAGDLLYIKVARIDGDGNDLTNTLETLSNITLPSGSSSNTYIINNVTRTNDYFLYYVTPPDRKDIANPDKSDLLYSFSGSYNTNLSLNNINSLLPIITSSIDNLNFFIPAGTTSSLGYPRNIGSYKIPTLPNKNLDIRISSSIQFIVEGSRSTTTDVTASIRILSTPFATNNPQNPIVLAEQVLTQSAQDLDGTDLIFTGSYDLSTTVNRGSFTPGHYIYLDAKVIAKNSGVDVPTFFNNGKFTNGIIEITSSAAINNFKTIVIEPFFTSPFEGTNCDVLYGNVSQPVFNPFLQDIDYGNGQIIPINNEAIISGSATKGTVPESYYTALSSVNLKYNGSKIQSQRYNIFTDPLEKTDFDQPFNIGTYGQTPSITLNQSLVAYIEGIEGTTPELNGKVAANIKYLINGNGDAVSPNLSSTTVRDVQMNFQEGDEIEVSLIEPPIGTGMQVLNGNKTIIKGGYRVEPILYTQIPTSPFSSSFFFDTSSLLPVDNVTFVANNTSRPTAQTILGGNSAVIEFPTQLQDSGSVYNPTTDTYTVNQFTIDSGVDVELRANIRVTTDGPPNMAGYYTVSISNDAYPGQISTVSYGPNPPILGTRVHNLYLLIKNEDLVLGQNFKVFFNATQINGNGVFTIEKGGTNPGGAPEPPSNFYASQVPAPNGNVEIELNNNPLWTFSGSSNNVLLGRTGAFSEMYDFLQQRTIEGSGFNTVQNIWKILPGDQFRFQDDESKVYNVIDVVDPKSNDLGQIIVTLDRGVSAVIDKDYFLIRRFVEDGSFIIFDENKPTGTSGAAFIKPRFVTDILNKDVDQFIQDLKSKNLLT